MPAKTLAAPAVRRNPRVAWRRIEDEAVLVHLEKDFYVTLDAVGTRVWELLGETTTVDRLAAALGDEFDGKPQRIAADLRKFLDQLADDQLIEFR